MPKFLGLSDRGDTAYLAWEDGHLLRVDTRNNQKPLVAEEVDLLFGKDAQLTALSFLIGKTTLVAGDSQGQIRVWFRTQPQNATSSDGNELTMVHDLGRGPAAVSSFAASMRSRLLGAGFADGTFRLFHVTSNQTLAEEKAGDAAVSALAIGPRDDLLAAIIPSGFTAWEMDRKHPAATLHTLFGKVHYEGMNEPLHIWQSSSGTDDFEPKYSLVSVVFGTLKATFYSMIFGVPLALLAAVYTTEFLEKKALRARIKPLVEFMESLPTVVLGFLAALIFATFVEGNITSVLAAFVTVPVSFVAAAYLFQLMPVDSFVRLTRFRFYLLFILALPVGIWMAGVAGPIFERLLFAGNIKAWLNGQIGTGGWFIMFLPVSAVTMVFLTVFGPFPPILPWNFRKPLFSARIFRILFLAALCLFLLTFVINTLAEVIRQRFRKRAFQL